MTLRVAHVSDLHLGFRQFSRQTSLGVNQREADVAVAFRQAIDGMIAAQPDLILVVGDVFHSVRPANPAILDSFNQFRRLREGLPDTPVVIVAGNHDTPRSADTVTILRLFEAIPQVYVVPREPRVIRFNQLGVAVTGFPRESFASSPRPVILPERGVTYNVLAMHGEIAGVVPGDRTFAESTGLLMELGDLRADRWSYVALGHYHVATAVTSNAWYSGSLEYVSTTPWSEIDVGPPGHEGEKGWLLVTLSGDGVDVQFHPVVLSRRHIDLPRIFCEGLTAEQISQQLDDHVHAVVGGIDGEIVRQVLHDVPRAVSRDLDHRAVREFKARALSFRLDIRRPPVVRETLVGDAGQRQPLPELLERYLQERSMTPGVDREAVVRLGRKYLTEASGGA